MERNRCYSEMILLPTFEERYRYLKIGGIVGEETFGFDRYMNQMFYKSKEWKRVRDFVITRDAGHNDYCCDLGVDGIYISNTIYIHHMNPIMSDDIKYATKYLLDPEFLVATSFNTHQAIHYGDESLLIATQPVQRRKNDTSPWLH